MQNLLQIEWLKLKHYRAFKVFGIIYLLGIIAVLFISYTMYVNVPPKEIQAMLGDPFAFPKLWSTMGWLNSWLLYFPGWLIITLCVNEFTFKTHRQNIIDGWSRKEFIQAKLLLILAFTVVITIINILSVFIIGLITGAGISFTGAEYIGYMFLQTLCYMLFAFFLAVLLRKSGLAAGIFFMYGLIFEFLISALINYKMGAKPIGHLLPLQASDVLLPPPSFFGKMYQEVPEAYVLILACLLYCSLYIFFAFRKFTKDDL
jgi:ABC-2 type transport system permease protein